MPLREVYQCCQCSRTHNEDGSPVTWVCAQCGRRVCRHCTLTDPSTLHRQYYDDTLCSESCRQDLVKEREARKAVAEVMES